MIDKKQMFRRQEVLDIMAWLLTTWHNLQFEFDKRLSKDWLNNNNWANDHLREDFINDFTNNLI